MNQSSFQAIWLGLCMGLIMVAAVMQVVAPEYPLFILINFSIGMIILIAMAFINRTTILKILRTQTFKNTFANILTIFLVSSILGMLNYLIYKNDHYFDFTTQGVHSLSDQSKKIAEDLTDELSFILYARRENWDRFLNLLNLYHQFNQQIKIHAIDIDTNPGLVHAHNIKEEGTVIAKYQGRQLSFVLVDELSVTNTILRLIRRKNLKIYYTTGHSEINLKQQDQEGGSYLYSKLASSGYELSEFDLLKEPMVPKDAHLLMILGPKDGFLDIELSSIDNYLAQGGALLVTLAPEFNEVKLSGLYSLLKKYGVNFHNSIILDRLAAVQGSQATIPIITEFHPEHSITKNFKGKILLPLSAALSNTYQQGKNYISLVQSNNFPGSFAETNFDEVIKGHATYDDKDIKGPVDIIVAVEQQSTQGRMIISGSSSFIVNGYQTQSSNFNFFLNLVAWGLGDEGVISLNRPTLTNEMIILSSSQITLIFYFAIVFLPFAMFAMAIYFYRRRLKK
jgi:ABC-type uncharacterized transport system involved in gliding motility auxiliary subunit